MRYPNDIRRLRLARGLSQQALAEATGVTTVQVRRYERGEARLSPGMMQRFASTFGASVADLYASVEPSSVVALPLRGGCFCGAVRYEVRGAPLMAHVCHCHACQTRSGSAFSLTVIVNAADLSVTGDLKAARRTTERGREVDDSACPACGVYVLARAVGAPEYASLRAGTLDDAGWVVPIAQIWTQSAIPWAVIPDVYSVDPDSFDYHRLGEAWRATGPAFRQA